MPYTYREYPVIEVAISAIDKAPLPSGHERRLAGDIIIARRPHHGIGLKERFEYLWLRIQGADLSVMSLLMLPIFDGFDQLSGRIYQKRRFSIPLHRLLQAAPWIDLVDVADPSSFYQPFIGYDDADLLRVIPGTEHPALPVEGLVFDNLTGKYL